MDPYWITTPYSLACVMKKFHKQTAMPLMFQLLDIILCILQKEFLVTHLQLLSDFVLPILPKQLWVNTQWNRWTGAAIEGGKWGDRPRPRSWGGPALQAYEFVKLYFPVNWKCWYMLRLKSFFKVKFHSVVLGCLLYHNCLHVAPKGTPVHNPLSGLQCSLIILK